MGNTRQAMTDKPLRILWASEQPVRHTGYGRVTRELAKRWVDMGHEVYCIGWDYSGEPLEHKEGWIMLDAGITGFGTWNIMGSSSPNMIEKHLLDLKPDVFASLIDIWYTGHMVRATNALNVPYINYCPIDGVPFSEQWRDIAIQSHTLLPMSNFGKECYNSFAGMMERAGDERYANFQGEDFIYHGADLELFKPPTPEEKQAYRQHWGIPDEWETVFLSVARNVNRKQTPKLLQAMSIMVYEKGIENIGLVLHCGDPLDITKQGWNLPQLVARYGLANHVMFTDRNSNPLTGFSTEEMATLYQACDAHILSTGGEGFGIPSAEALASGLPIIVPGNSTGPELAGATAVGKGERGWVAGLESSVVGAKWGVELGLVSAMSLADCMAEALDADTRKALGQNARKWAEENLDWDSIAESFIDLFRSRMAVNHPLGEGKDLTRAAELNQWTDVV